MRFRKYVVFLICATGFAVSLEVMAGAVTANVTHIYSGPGFGTKVFIAVDKAVVNGPGCSTNSLYAFSLDSAAPGANTWISMLTVAYTTGKSVDLIGANECTPWVNIEDLRYLRLNPS